MRVAPEAGDFLGEHDVGEKLKTSRSGLVRQIESPTSPRTPCPLGLDSSLDRPSDTVAATTEMVADSAEPKYAVCT